MNKRAIQALTAAAFVVVGVVVWKMTSKETGPAPPPPQAASKDGTPAAAAPDQPAVARPKVPAAEPPSDDPCVEARKWFEGQPGAKLPKTERAQVALSWDAGLAFGASEPPLVVDAAYHNPPAERVPVGDVELVAAKGERIQSVIAMTADEHPQVLALVWSGVDVSDPERLAPEGDAYASWSAFHNAKLEMRYYGWSGPRLGYEVEDVVAGPVTKCEAPFGCGELLTFPRPRLVAVGADLLMVKTKVLGGCGAEEDVCAPLEWATVFDRGPDGSKQIMQLPLEIYTAQRPVSPPMRQRVFMFEPVFQDMDGDGKLDLAARAVGERYVKFVDPEPEVEHEGHEHAVEPASEGGEEGEAGGAGGSAEAGAEEAQKFSRYELRDSMYPNRDPFELRWLLREGQLIEVERTFGDVVYRDWNRAQRVADNGMVAMTVTSVMRVLRGLAVGVEGLADLPGPAPDTSVDRGLTCLVSDLEGTGKAGCSILGRERVLVSSRDEIVGMLVGALELVEMVKGDVPAEPMKPVHERFKALFGALCPRSTGAE